MKRLMMIVAVLALAAPALVATLCKKCNDQMAIMSIGKCTDCKGHTSSGANKLCRKCSAKQGKCERCLVALAEAKPKPAPAKCKKCSGMMVTKDIGKCTACKGRTTSGSYKLCMKCAAMKGKCQMCLVSTRNTKPAAKPAKSAWAFKKQVWGEYNKDRASMAVILSLLDGKSFIADAATFAKVWTVLNGKDKLPPPISWENEIVTYFTVIAKNSLIPYVRDKGDGAIQAGAVSTRTLRGGPGFCWAMETYPRKGVKTINGKALPDAKAAKLAVPASGKVIILSIKDSGRGIEAAVGDTILIKFEDNPLTGFSWSAAELAKGSAVEYKLKRFYSDEMNSQRPPMPFRGGEMMFAYRVIATGKATITLVYKNSREKTKAPAKTFTVTIDAKPAPVKPAPAKCKKCSGMMVTKDIGKCTACKGRTTSGSYKLCMKCAAMKGKCQMCLVSTRNTKPAAKPAKSAWAFKKQVWGEYNKDRASMAVVHTEKSIRGQMKPKNEE